MVTIVAAAIVVVAAAAAAAFTVVASTALDFSSYSITIPINGVAGVGTRTYCTRSQR